jgi:DNA-binding NarL/FixJ family response regulator
MRGTSVTDFDDGVIRLLLVDSDRILCQGVKALAERHDDLVVVATAATARQAMEIARSERFDVLVTEVSMNGVTGPDLCRWVLEQSPHVRVLALSRDTSSRSIGEMFRAGASGYLLKKCGFEEFRQAVTSVAGGQMYLSPCIAGYVVDDFIRGEGGQCPGLQQLSQREREILHMVTDGLSTKQIAYKLDVTPRTVDAHRQRIMEKLDMNSVAELTKYAIREGLIPLEE